jgi:hypothetical protein
MFIKAKENSKVKDAFEMLVRKILTKNPAAGSSGDSASGVFGGGKGDK